MLEMTPRLQKKLDASQHAGFRAAEKSLRITQSLLLEQIGGLGETIAYHEKVQAFVDDFEASLAAGKNRADPAKIAEYRRFHKSSISKCEQVTKWCEDALKESFLNYTTQRDRVQASLEDAETNAQFSVNNLILLVAGFFLVDKFFNLAE